MQTRSSSHLKTLEQKFWQSMVDEDTDTALSLLDEPALMVSEYGAMQFDHADYRRMAEEGPRVVRHFELSDMNVVFPTEDTAVLTYHVRQSVSGRDGTGLVDQDMADSSVWTRKDGNWRCVMHTETPVVARPA
jgi:hypothetical protein